MQNHSTDNCIHKINPAAPDFGADVIVMGYAWGGNEIDPADPKALAKKSYDTTTKSTRYWLKRATTGADAGNLFNPQSPTFEPSLSNKYYEAFGRGRYEFRPESAEAFDLYLRFITTGNSVNLRHAERV